MTAPHQVWPRVRLMLEQGMSAGRELASTMQEAGFKGLLQSLPQRFRQHRLLPEKDYCPEQDLFEKLVDRYVHLKSTLFPIPTKRRLYFDRLIQPIKTIIGFSEAHFDSLHKLHRYIISHQELYQYLTQITQDKIIISKRGALGDALLLYWLAHAVRRRFPHSRLFLLSNIRGSSLLSDLTRFLSNIVIVNSYESNYKNFLKIASNEKMFDLIIDCRYATKVTATSPKYQEFSSQVNSEFLKYSGNFTEFPLGNQVFSKYGKSLFEMVRITSGLELRPFDMTISLSPEDFAIAAKLRDRPFITIGTGVDQYHTAKKYQHRSTKQWTPPYWEDLVEKLTSLGLLVVQLGTQYDEPLPYALNLLGMTTFREAAALIKQALCHISVEGGLVWSAKAVGTRAVVLFGPTDRDFFGLPENRNLSAALPCSPCWWRTENWMFACPEGYDRPRCMDALTPNLVFQEVQTLLAEKRDESEPHFYLREVQFFPSQAPEPKTRRPTGKPKVGGSPFELRLAQTYLRVIKQTRLTAPHREYVYAREKAGEFSGEQNPLKILGVGAGLEAVYPLLLQKGCHVTVAAQDWPHWLKVKDTEIWSQEDAEPEVAFNSLYNLSFPSGHFDLVLVFSALDNHDFKGFALREILRVLKSKGILLITLPFIPLKGIRQRDHEFLQNETLEKIFDESSLAELLRQGNIQGEYSEEIIREKHLQATSPQKKRHFGDPPRGLTIAGLVIAKE